MNKALLALIFLTSTITINAQEWIQWRGPARDGSVWGKNVPAKWPEALQRSWWVEIGEGYSSPVVANGRVFVHGRRDPEEIIAAINLADGKVLWAQKYQAVFKKNQYAVEMAKGPNSTPLVIGNRLFTIGVSAIVNAWDTATVRLLWTRDFSKSIDTSKMFCGTAASPLVADGRVVVQVGSDIHGGKILALNPGTGATEWEWSGLGPGYASPVVIDLGGVRHLVTMTQGSIVGVDAKTGKELWSVPFPDEWQWATEGREGEHASLLLTPQHVIFLTNGADLIVAKRNTPAFAVEKRYEVAEAATWAMPVLLGSNILVRDATGLMLLTGK